MLLASGVKLADPLKQPLGDISAKGQGNLAMALGKLRTQATASNKASGRVQGTYQDQALNQAGTMAGRGVNDSLYGVLGGTSLDQMRKQQEYERNVALAKEIGDKMSPSVAEEVLGGLSQGVSLAAKGKGIYDVLGQPSASGGSNPLTLGRYSGRQPGMASYPPISYEDPNRLQSYDPYQEGY